MKPLITFIIGILLFLTALGIVLLAFVPCLIYEIIRAVISYKMKGFGKEIGKYFYGLALALDHFGNVAFDRQLRYLFLTYYHRDPFGNSWETISSVLGKNKRTGNLNQFGRWMCAFLDWLDKDHCKKSIIELKENGRV